MPAKPATVSPAEARAYDRAAEWLARRDAGLRPEEEAELRAWLDADPVHRDALDYWESAWTRLDAPHAAGRVEAFTALLAQRAARRRQRRFAGAAAGLAVLLVGAFTWRAAVPMARPTAESAPVAAQTSLWRPGTQTLPDGTVVELNAGAKIETHYSASARRVALLAGEAHFEVVPDAARPFYVEAAGVQVRAVGTAFSVNLEAKSVAVLVTHGRVAVSPEARESAPAAPVVPLAVLDIGQRVVVDLAQPQPATSGVTTPAVEQREELLAWRAPRVTFTGVSLAEAVQLLNREAAAHHRPRFVLSEPGMEGVRISGLFRLDHTEAFVRLLEHGFGIVAEPRGTEEIVLRRAP